MNCSTNLRVIVSSVLFLAFSVAQSAYGQKTQKIDWAKDTISAKDAKNGQYKFRSEWNGAGKKTTAAVTLPVDKLKDIMDACTEKGIGEIQIYIVMIRPEDVNHFAAFRPGMSESDKRDMIGRQSVVLKVPRAAFFDGASQSGSKISVPKTNPLMLSLLGAGLFQIENPGKQEAAFVEEYVYFSIAVICPPPASCGD